MTRYYVDNNGRFWRGTGDVVASLDDGIWITLAYATKRYGLVELHGEG